MKKLFSVLAGLLLSWTAFGQTYPEDSDWARFNNDNSGLNYQFHDAWGNSEGSMQGNGQGWDLYDRYGNKIGTVEPQ